MSSSGPDVAPELRQVTRLRNTDSAKFKTLCHMHLSFLLDLDGTSLEDILGDDAECKAVKKSHNFPHFGRKKSKGETNSLNLDFTCVENIEVLIRYLNRPENITLEGLFRKCGQLNRQRVLRGKLMSEATLDLDDELSSGTYTAHDCANLLKTFLGELSEPLLTEKHFSIYCKIPDMVTANTLECDRRLLESRQMTTAQLLIQLLRRENAALLRGLLTLLHQVAKSPGNLMTSETLGTMFAPHILVPRQMSASELQQVMNHTTRAVAFLIEHAPDVFKVPAALVRDISAYWHEMEEASDSRQGCDNDMDGPTCHHKYRGQLDADALRTTVTFVNRQALQRASSQTDTQVELAQLYAHIGSMPESAKKRKLLKQFNRANGTGTPVAVGKHKRSKSFSESIKKMVGRSNHKRQGSGTSAPSLASSNDPTIPSNVLTPNIVQTHTPIIRSGRPVASCAIPNSGFCSPAMPSPVLRLFKDADQHQPILPSNPCVHIVDLKPQASIRRMNRRYQNSPPIFRTPRPMSASAHTVVTAARRLVENGENVAPMATALPAAVRWTTCSNSRSPCAPVIVTPDRRFAKASCRSPMLHPLPTKAPGHMKAMIMTPHSCRRVALLKMRSGSSASPKLTTCSGSRQSQSLPRSRTRKTTMLPV